MSERDNRFVYGARCVWWDDITKVGRHHKNPRVHNADSHPLPCCPFCGSVLFEIEDAQWKRGVDEYERIGHAGYRAFTDWRRGKCYPNLPAAHEAYVKATGKRVENFRR